MTSSFKQLSLSPIEERRPAPYILGFETSPISPYSTSQDEYHDDKAKHHILPPSRFGLVEITRQRVRPVLDIDTKEGCPSCKGTGKIEASILLIDEIGQKIIKAISNSDNIILKTHPFVASYINKGWFKNQRRTWAKDLGCKLAVEEDTTYHLLQYRFFNNERKVINV